MLQDTGTQSNIRKIMPVKDDADRMQLIIGKDLKAKLKKLAKKEDPVGENVSLVVRRILNDYFKK